VGTAIGTSFTDSGLISETTYSYQVRATDAAANLSAYSNVASVTTAIAPPPPPLATLPAWVAALAPGQWYQIPNTSLSSVDPVPLPLGNTGPRAKVDVWTSFVVDTRTSKVYSVANGGHSDYAGNEVDELSLELDQPLWNEKLSPTPNNLVTAGNSYYADGRPTSRHTYYGVTFNARDERIMLFGGGIWGPRGDFHTAVSSYQIGTNAWNPSGTHANLPTDFSGVAAYALDPLTSNVYAARNLAFGRWNSSTNTFATLNPTGDRPKGDESPSAMDTTRGRILIVGGLENDRHLYTISTNSFTTVTLSGPNAAQASGAAQASMVYVEAIDRFLIRRAGGGGAVYQVHPSTFEVTQFATTGGDSIPSTLRPYNKFLYVPRLGGCVYVPSYSGNAWFLRIH
jgi:chitodextrinase